MKRFAALALILGIALFSFGCAESGTKKKAEPTKPGVEKKEGDTKEATPAKKEEPKKEEPKK
ncbi:MAG: hypothetical protein JXM70_27625 [Pirellulales bacterium]|nr:hypothetical protein [Pirellulales bacterium]